MTLIDFFLEPLACQKPKHRSCSGPSDINTLSSGSAAFHCWQWHSSSHLRWGLPRRTTALLSWGSWHEPDVQHQCGLFSGLYSPILPLLLFYSCVLEVLQHIFDSSVLDFHNFFCLFKHSYPLLWSIWCTVTSECLDLSFSLLHVECHVWKVECLYSDKWKQPMVTSHIF